MTTETVILVHGLWVHGIAMELMRRRVARCGFRALAYSYPSMRLTLAENAERLARFCRDVAAPQRGQQIDDQAARGRLSHPEILQRLL